MLLVGSDPKAILLAGTSGQWFSLVGGRNIVGYQYATERFEIVFAFDGETERALLMDRNPEAGNLHTSRELFVARNTEALIRNVEIQLRAWSTANLNLDTLIWDLEATGLVFRDSGLYLEQFAVSELNAGQRVLSILREAVEREDVALLKPISPLSVGQITRLLVDAGAPSQEVGEVINSALKKLVYSLGAQNA